MIESELRQRLLELEYDLLSEEEAAQLRSQIENDPNTARTLRRSAARPRAACAGRWLRSS